MIAYRMGGFLSLKPRSYTRKFYHGLYVMGEDKVYTVIQSIKTGYFIRSFISYYTGLNTEG
jgi:hypothetical protein